MFIYTLIIIALGLAIYGLYKFGAVTFAKPKPKAPTVNYEQVVNELRSRIEVDRAFYSDSDNTLSAQDNAKGVNFTTFYLNTIDSLINKHTTK